MYAEFSLQNFLCDLPWEARRRTWRGARDRRIGRGLVMKAMRASRESGMEPGRQGAKAALETSVATVAPGRSVRTVALKRWMLILLGVGSVLLVPWMVVLALTLPGSTQVQHWSVAWIGIDVLMAAGCAATALLGLRADPRARLTASATAAVAVLDAWFDITTSSSGGDLVQALACAVAEAGLAWACVALALSEPHKSGPREPMPTKPSLSR